MFIIRYFIPNGNNMEIWKKIEDYPKYSVSNKGRVRNDTTGKFLKFQLTRNGQYYKVTLYGPNKPLQIGVHRLVAEAFIPNPNNLSCVNHLDEDKLNNHVSNLEWCTIKHNTQYSCGVQVLIDGIKFPSLSDAGKYIGSRHDKLQYALKQGKTTYKGHSISYA